MKFYFVGLDLRNDAYDYSFIQKALHALHGRRVSPRIWLCVVNSSKGDTFASISRQLAAGDQMMVVEVPPTMRLPHAIPRAA